MQFAPGAWRLALVPALLAVPAGLLSPVVGVGLGGLAAVVLYVHRDPDRSPPDHGIVAPADGRVSVRRRESVECPDGGVETRVRLGVFMGPGDVHVNRAPLPGRVDAVTHRHGGHWPAFSKASDRNERLEIGCGEYRVTLIAGAVARRIHPYVEPGDRLVRGQRIGHVSFGSRADVLMPPGVELDDVRVSIGDRVRAGETVLVDR